MTKAEILEALVRDIKKSTTCILATESYKKKQKPPHYIYMGV